MENHSKCIKIPFNNDSFYFMLIYSMLFAQTQIDTRFEIASGISGIEAWQRKIMENPSFKILRY